jgi:hypothetical protein
MKKIVAILLALAVVSMAFAQTVSISNTVKSEPQVTIDGGNQYWGFANNFFLREEVNGEAITADGRAKVKGRIRFDLQTMDPYETSILSFKPRWSWNSSANAADGNRSSVAAVLKPWDIIEIGVGNLDDVGYAFSTGPGLNGNWAEPWVYGFNNIPNLGSEWQNQHELIKDGIQVLFTGVDSLKIGVGFRSASSDLRTMVKKGMFNGLAIGASYDTDLFQVGAKYGGNFGWTAEKNQSVAAANAAVTAAQVAGNAYIPSVSTVAVASSNTAEGNDKAYQDHTIYAGFTFKGLQEAKIGTTIDAAVGFYTEKASALKNGSTQTTAFLFGAGAGFNFRNGIKDDIHVLVGYVKQGSTSAKVLPFAVTNNISYTVDSDATFSFKLAYVQTGLSEKKSGTASNNTNYYYNTMSGIQVLDANGNVTTAGAKASPLTAGQYGWLIGAQPNFSWNMGAHSFSLGVKAVTLGDIVPHAKNGWEWSWTGLRGRKAIVSFPLSWTYTF